MKKILKKRDTQLEMVENKKVFIDALKAPHSEPKVDNISYSGQLDGDKVMERGIFWFWFHLEIDSTNVQKPF